LHGGCSAWSKLGADGYIPYNVLVDRDKKVRRADHGAGSAAWETTIKECSGAI